MFGFLKKGIKDALSKITTVFLGEKKEEEPSEEKAPAAEKPVPEAKIIAKPQAPEKTVPKIAESPPEKLVEKPALKEHAAHKPAAKREPTAPVPTVEPQKKITEPLLEEVKAIREEQRREAHEEAKHADLAQEKAKLHKETIHEIIEEIPEVKAQPVVETKVEKKGFFKRLTETITTTKIGNDQFEKFFWDLELALLENNVAVEVIEKIKEDLRKTLVDRPISRSEVQGIVLKSLRNSINEVLSVQPFNIFDRIKTKKPYIICFVGINGSGKTTTIAKMAYLFQQHGLHVVIAAADTFRAAAIDQLQEHGDRLGVKVIKHDYGSDPAAVAFDAIQHARAKNADLVLIDTAGRMHSNTNLIDEMKKIIRVAQPDLKLFIGESITGNDCVEQAKEFNAAIEIDGIILSKADIDEKGGAAVSVSYTTKKPILYLGVGQEYKDLQSFDSRIILENLGL